MTVDGPKIEGSITQVMALLALIMAHLIFIGSYVGEKEMFLLIYSKEEIFHKIYQINAMI
jgi:hypothetical protein